MLEIFKKQGYNIITEKQTEKGVIVIFLYVAIGLILIAISALTFFFFYTFVRNKKVFNLDQTFFETNGLTQFKTDMLDGIRYIETEPFDQVYTTSYDGLKLAGKYYKHNGNHKGTIILFHGYRSGIGGPPCPYCRIAVPAGRGRLHSQRCHRQQLQR